MLENSREKLGKIIEKMVGVNTLLPRSDGPTPVLSKM